MLKAAGKITPAQLAECALIIIEIACYAKNPEQFLEKKHEK